MKYFLIALLLLSAPAHAQGYYSVTKPKGQVEAQADASGGSATVTTVQKCYDQIGPEEAAKIKATSLTPYTDCQKRMRTLEKDKKIAQETPQEPETPQNYVRVDDPAALDVPAQKAQ